MEHSIYTPKFSLLGSGLAQIGRKPARRLRRRVWKRLPGRIVPMPQTISKRRALKATVSSGLDVEMTGEKEQAWVRSHWREHVGRWVALDGACLLGAAPTAREALDMARARGVSAPFLVQIAEPSELPFGGW